MGHGKKTRNPGFKPGQHWVICDRCGFAVREGDAVQEWNGLVVCKDDFEPRHPQDFVRAREDRQAPEGLHRSEPTDVFREQDCDRSAIAGSAVAGCAIAGVASSGSSDSIPASTF